VARPRLAPVLNPPAKPEAGFAKSFTIVPRLVDTNVLVYRFDHRFPEKQAIATLAAVALT
jgi:hypothetical protein